MTEIAVNIRGLPELHTKLGADVLGIIEPVITTSVIRVEHRLKVYPAARSGQSYRRTGTLGRRWTYQIRRTAEGVIGEIGNNTVYGPWVQSQQFQAWMHRERWTTDEQALQEEAPLLEAEAEEIVIRALSRG
ncbi:MAG: hypothetical protein DCC55_11420 [Chloroflexi bacterium]|nr:MAG: hypothetical protein DCC55_11420 [Chloroflexota bacterium]